MLFWRRKQKTPSADLLAAQAAIARANADSAAVDARAPEVDHILEYAYRKADLLGYGLFESMKPREARE